MGENAPKNAKMMVYKKRLIETITLGAGDRTWRFARRPGKQPHRAVWFAR